MKMDINELVLQMTYAAAQMAQNTIPQTQEPTRTEDGKSFQNLMDEKRTERTERESKAPETTTAATQTAQQGQTAASGAPVMQQLAAMVTAVSVMPAASLAMVLPVAGAITRTSSSPFGPMGSTAGMSHSTSRPVSSSIRSIRSSEVPKRVSVKAEVSEAMGITVS